MVELVLCAGLASAASGSAQVATASEHDLKAAFLYNFARFVDWPSTAFAEPGDPVVLCLEEGEFADVLARAVEDKKVHGRDLLIRPWSESATYEGCHMLFLAEIDTDAWVEQVGLLEERNVLTVGEMERFAREGGIINFVREGDKLRFEVNPAAADRTNLRISSKLLRLAQVVDEEGN